MSPTTFPQQKCYLTGGGVKEALISVNSHVKTKFFVRV